MGAFSRCKKMEIMGEEIEIVSEYTYLGVILTPKMSFTRHVEQKYDAKK